MPQLRLLAPAVVVMLVMVLDGTVAGGTVAGGTVGAGPVAVGSVGASPVAQTEPPGVLSGTPPPGVGLSPEVAAVPASSADLGVAVDALDGLERQQRVETIELVDDSSELEVVRAELVPVRSLAARRAEQRDKAAQVAERTRTALRGLTVDRFVEGDHLFEGLDPALSAQQRDQMGRQMVLAQVGADRLLAQLRHVSVRVDALTVELEDLQARVGEFEARATRLSGRVDELRASLGSIEPRIVDARRRRDVAAMSATIDGTDLSATALDAYWRAERFVALAQPDCGVSWWALAGIGRTESLHGTYRGARLGVDGAVDPPIFGPDLDGSNRFAVIRDSDGGRLDGTSRTDRAVGPMQFLPGTWGAVGTDATGDGTADPQNLFDAAASAGIYLCRRGPGLQDPERLNDAYLSYNRSREYVRVVDERARGYAAAVPLG